jgi:hypothetical protein
MEITRIPKSIRQIKLKDFDKYGGNVQACVQAIAKERMAESEGEGHAKKRFVSVDYWRLRLSSYIWVQQKVAGCATRCEPGGRASYQNSYVAT